VSTNLHPHSSIDIASHTLYEFQKHVCGNLTNVESSLGWITICICDTITMDPNLAESTYPQVEIALLLDARAVFKTWCNFTPDERGFALCEGFRLVEDVHAGCRRLGVFVRESKQA
jgi:hypothetical protein